MQFEIRVDRERCIGSGQCVHVAPGTFDQDDEAKAYVHDRDGEPVERIVRAVTACPMQAISLEVEGVHLGPEVLANWRTGAHSADPLVEVLGSLSGDHEALLDALTSAARHDAPESSMDEVVDLTREHLAEEGTAYDEIAHLLDPDLVAAFSASHDRIRGALERLGDSDGAVTALKEAVEGHIRLEETMLFPAVFGALGRRPSAG